MDCNGSDISVVIPCYNSEKTILMALKALEKQTLLPTEVLVVDCGSTDATTSVIESFQEHSTLNIQILHCLKKTPGAARNKGIDRAQGDFILCLDSDVIVDSTAVANFRGALHEYPLMLATCRAPKNSNALTEELLRRENQDIIKGHGNSRLMAFHARLKKDMQFNESLKASEDQYLFQKIPYKYQMVTSSMGIHQKTITTVSLWKTQKHRARWKRSWSAPVSKPAPWLLSWSIYQVGKTVFGRKSFTELQLELISEWATQ